MRTQAHISFQDMATSEIVRTTIENRVAEGIEGLEAKFGRIVSCRVSIKGPSEHHRQGGPYEVRLQLTLPGSREVHVDRTPGADKRHADLNFALADAFRRAGRQLQDEARLLQGAIKSHPAKGNPGGE